LQDQFHDGVVFVPLAQLSTIDELLPALAGALKAHLPPGGDLQQAVLDHLAGQQILLVLDNFEHLMEEAALIYDILVNGPQVKILVTSKVKTQSRSRNLVPSWRIGNPPPDHLRNGTI
jgi:predicted ATPase